MQSPSNTCGERQMLKIKKIQAPVLSEGFAEQLLSVISTAEISFIPLENAGSTEVSPTPSLPTTHSPRSLRCTNSSHALNTLVSSPTNEPLEGAGKLLYPSIISNGYLRKLKSHLQNII